MFYFLADISILRLKCQFCGLQCQSRTILKRHTVIHTGEKLYKCDICLAAFNRKENLKRHMMTHTGEKPYTCDVCGKTFTSKYYHNVHIRMIHKKMWSFAIQSSKQSRIYGISTNLGYIYLHETRVTWWVSNICGAWLSSSDI